MIKRIKPKQIEYKMCTKEEVREVVRSESPSKLSKTLSNFGMIGLIALVSWLLFDANQTGKVILEYKRVNEVALAHISGEIKRLNDNLSNAKDVFVSRSSDRYYGKDARARAKLVDELFKSVQHDFNLSQERQDRAEERQNRAETRINRVEDQIKNHDLK